MTEIKEKWRAYLDTLGANAGFVEGLIGQYLEDPAQVDERWRHIFDAVAWGQARRSQTTWRPVAVDSAYHYELDPINYGLTLWDPDRSFIAGGLSAKLGDAPQPTATLREILESLRQTYCGKIGVEYMDIQHPEQKSWLQMRIMERDLTTIALVPLTSHNKLDYRVAVC